jgi:hypothetical protein
MDDSDRAENELLLAPATKAKRAMNQIHAAGVGIFWNRIFMVLLLAILVAFGLFSESQIMVLQAKLEDTEQQVEALQILTEKHQKVIERFSESITNEDVLKRLGVLEQNMTETETYLHTELQKNEDLIQKRLDAESKELQDHLMAAEAEIDAKVQSVENDMRTNYIETKAQFSMENSFMVYQLAGTFTLLSCLISMWHMTAHLRKLNQPMVQRKILAILWMSPVYAITSWFSLVFPKAEGYLAIIKDGYEAYIIYQFLSFCIAVIGKGDRGKVVDILATHADHLTPPFRLTALCELCGFCKPPPNEDKRQLADEILLQCQFVRCFCCCWCCYVCCIAGSQRLVLTSLIVSSSTVTVCVAVCLFSPSDDHGHGLFEPVPVLWRRRRSHGLSGAAAVPDGHSERFHFRRLYRLAQVLPRC